MKKTAKNIVEDFGCLKVNDILRFNYSDEDFNKKTKEMLIAIGSIDMRVTVCEEEHEINIPLTTAETGFGGQSIYFKCSHCQKRIRNLYYNRYRFGCRKCLDLSYELIKYRNSRFYEVAKVSHQLNKVQSKLRNKWLRNPTKSRLRKEEKEIGEQFISLIRKYSDEAFAELDKATSKFKETRCQEITCQSFIC